MAQAGLHSLISMPLRKFSLAREGLMLGVVVGSMLPDADNLAVAVATVTKASSQGLHRTFSHSLFTVIAVIAVFYLVSLVTKRASWNNLGLGLGLGILLHSLVDIFLWFDGVAILWPIPVFLNLWNKIPPPDWWTTLMQPVELLFFALFFWSLYTLARKQASDLGYLGKLRLWIAVETALFVIFLILAYVLSSGFLTIFGVVYLLSLGLAIGIAIRMRATIESNNQSLAA